MLRRLLSRALAASAVLAATPAPAADLRPAGDFAQIADPAHRSVALFEEAGKVIQHPRCVNCHPAGDRPLQGDEARLHVPAVQRGDGGIGVAGLRCTACHGAANYDPAGVPGHPKWALAPIEMAWEGRTLGEICEQIKDPARNGGHDMAFIVDHMAHDSLVGWGWYPDAGRGPVPGTQVAFGELIKAWADAGAHCPPG